MTTKFAMLPAILTAALLTPVYAQVFHPGPPAGFDPVKASPAERERYGFPPMPKQTSAKAYAHWVKVVSAPQTRVENPKAEPTDIINYPAQGITKTGAVGNTTYALSTNWSGYAVYLPTLEPAIAPGNTSPEDGLTGPFIVNDSTIYSETTVPFVNKENCTYAPFAVFEWVGFDGFSNGDVLQAGIGAIGCPATTYYAWYEWFEDGCPFSSTNQPCYATAVNLPVNPGDVIEQEVWYTTTAPQGHAYLLNYTQEKAIAVSFYQPLGTAVYLGNSAEWIVERPGIGNGLANLSNYWGAQMVDDYALGLGEYSPSSADYGATIFNLTMICPSWNPALECKYLTALSYANLFGPEAIGFAAAGPAISQ